MKKIYLAGPEVFLKESLVIGERKKALCGLYGFEGIYPLDNTISFYSETPKEKGLKIAKSNEDLIKKSDYIIANMTPFRGTSCDVGTAYEMGFAKALGKGVFAYTNDNRSFLKRNINDLDGVTQISSDEYIDKLGMSIENFDLVDNLMLDGSVSKGIIQHSLIEEDQKYQELLGFEQCLKQIYKIENSDYFGQ